MARTEVLSALFSGARRQILCALFAEPERWWTLGELSGHAGLQLATLRRHLALLKRGHIVREENNNGHLLVQADPSGPVYSEMHSIVTKLASRHTAETILIVEDQPATARITRILLESWGYHVLEAHCGSEAIDIFEKHRDTIRLLLSDIMIPDMSGARLAEDLRSRNPNLRIVLMSGYHSDDLRRQDTAFLPKPFNPVSLSRIVRRELDRSEYPSAANLAGD